MTDPVLISVHDQVATVTLNRPDKANAVSLEMFDALAAAGREVAANRSVRAVVLNGAGDNFCAGIDVSVFQDPSTDFGERALAPPARAALSTAAASIWSLWPPDSKASGAR